MIKLVRSYLVFKIIPKLALALGLLLSQYAGAQSTTGERWYQVELIVFKRQLQNQQEQWPTSIKLAYPRNWVELKNPEQPAGQTGSGTTESGIATREDTRSDLQNSAFVLLEKNEKNLARHAAALQRDSRFTVLFHETWRQPVTATRNAPAILIRGGANYGRHAELEGSITVSLAQLLQVKTHLWLTEFARNQGQFSGDWPTLPVAPNLLQAKVLEESIADDTNYQVAQLPISATRANLLTDLSDPYVPARIVQMVEERKMRIKELHYIDHPLFGLIVQISAYDPSAHTL